MEYTTSVFKGGSQKDGNKFALDGKEKYAKKHESLLEAKLRAMVLAKENQESRTSHIFQTGDIHAFRVYYLGTFPGKENLGDMEDVFCFHPFSGNSFTVSVNTAFCGI